MGCAYFIYKNENDFRKSGKILMMNAIRRLFKRKSLSK